MSNVSAGAGRVSPLLAAALAYGKLGWKVFPIRQGTKDAPHLRDWGVFATSSRKQIAKWWTKFPRDNIGLACGPSLIAVVDVDTKEGKNGQRTIDLLEVLDGLRLSPTRTLRTPSGGRQHFYAGEVTSTVSKIGAHHYDKPSMSHVDTRGTGGANGGYVLLPPSRTVADAKRHTHAGVYRWTTDAPLAPVDAWVVEACGAKPESPEHTAEPVVEWDQPANIEWAIKHLQNDAQSAIEGQGGEFATLKVAMTLRGYGISEPKALELMLEHYNVDGKCIPLWEIDGKDGLAKKVANAFLYANLEVPGASTAEAQFADDPLPPLTEAEKRATRRERADREDAAGARRRRRKNHRLALRRRRAAEFAEG
jgi:bifunctional DNA primase/polymerase-like protein